MEHSQSIPFAFGARLKIQSVANSFFKAQPTVAGIIGKDAILVQDPAFGYDDEISGRIGGDIMCTYVHEGCVYEFNSRFKQFFYKDVAIIDYPEVFRTHQLRRRQRIRLNLAAESVMSDVGKLLNVEIRDISETGCRLVLPGSLQLAPGTPVSLTFHLPNEELIEDLECTVMNVRHMAKVTLIGVSFSGPTPEVEKIGKLCEMCSYFKV